MYDSECPCMLIISLEPAIIIKTCTIRQLSYTFTLQGRINTLQNNAKILKLFLTSISKYNENHLAGTNMYWHVFYTIMWICEFEMESNLFIGPAARHSKLSLIKRKKNYVYNTLSIILHILCRGYGVDFSRYF